MYFHVTLRENGLLWHYYLSDLGFPRESYMYITLRSF